ncbi:MAG: type II secretion system F family protein [Planctomycetales bacterium]|nr:type II secretion system F family protein [Planctomycetales bacterium]
MIFEYRARDPLGKEMDGKIDTKNVEDARQQLRRDGFRVLEIQQQATGGMSLFGPRVKKYDIIYMTAQLAIMAETGITISVGLESLAEETENAKLRAILLDMKKQVEGGEDLSTALARHPKYFDQTYVSLVRASEANGSLGAMLDRIATYQRKEQETVGKVRSAMAYPAVMATVAIGVTIFLLTFIMPKFAPLFAQKGKELPKITIAMMTVSNNLIAYWYFWLLGLLLFVAGFLYFRRTPRGKAALDWVKLNVPIVGPMCRKVALSRSIRTLGTMLASGVSVLDALKLASDVAGNMYYERTWRSTLDQVTSGSQIYETLVGNALFPSMLVQMMRSGEETGRLDVVLEKVSSYYDGEVEMALKTATSMIEPLLIVVMGSVVGTIAIALLLPIFSMGH